MNWRMYLSFFKWCFLKVFGGLIRNAEIFREELKKGAPESIFACFAYIGLTMISFIVFAVVVLNIFNDARLAKYSVAGYFFLLVFSFFYNIVKAAFECFMDDYEEPLRILKNKD